MSDDLVERVAQLYEAKWGVKDHWLARAAIAVVLEEAAKVAGKWQQMYFEDEKVHSSNITEYIVADIRALVKQSTTEEERA